MGEVKRLSDIFDELGFSTAEFREAINGLRIAVIEPSAEQLHDAQLDLLKMRQELNE